MKPKSPTLSAVNAHFPNDELLKAQDQLATLNVCLDAFADLLMPATDFGGIDRDNISMLYGYLRDQQKQAQAQLDNVLDQLRYNHNGVKA